MKRMKHIFLTSLIAVSLSFSPVSSSPVIQNTATVEAASETKNSEIVLNKREITLEKGKSITLKITGTTSKVVYSTSNKKIATVNSKGKVTAKKKGTVTITAKVDSAIYECEITVKNPTTSSSSNKTSSTNKTSTNKVTSSSTDEEVSYVLNTSTLKIHKTTCGYVEKIAKKNYATTNKSVDELEKIDYTTCGYCF